MLRRVDPVRIVQILANTRCKVLWRSSNRALPHSHSASTTLAQGTRQTCTNPRIPCAILAKASNCEWREEQCNLHPRCMVGTPTVSDPSESRSKIQSLVCSPQLSPTQAWHMLYYFCLQLCLGHMLCRKTPRAHPGRAQARRTHRIQDFWGHHAFPGHRCRKIWRPQIWSFRRLGKPSIS